MVKLTGCFFVLLLFCYLTPAQDINASLPRDPFSNAQQTITASENYLMQTAWIPLYFIKANQIFSFISNKQTGFLSANGLAHAEPQTNQLWVKDDAAHIKQIKAIIAHLDQRAPQFMIKARIITIDRRYQQSLGIELNGDNKSTNTDALTMNTPALSSDANTFSFNLAKLSDNNLINLKLSALEQEGHATLISTPTLITLNNQMASIESGAQVPYQESTSSGATSVSFKKAVLGLKVTPQLLPHTQILLHISLNQDKVSALTVKGVPAIETQQMTTQVITKNNQMVILGGILEENRAKQTEGIPILSHTPFIGALFRHQHHQNEQQILVICITPMIMSGMPATV